MKTLNALDTKCEVMLHYTLSIVHSFAAGFLPFDGRVLILCKSPVCVWLLQLHEKRERHIDSNLPFFFIIIIF